MHSSQQEVSLSSPESSVASSTSLDIDPTSYLTVPSTNTSRPRNPLPGPRPTYDEVDPLSLPDRTTTTELVPPILISSFSPTLTAARASPPLPSQLSDLASRVYMSIYSTSSFDTDNSEYSNPPARDYRVPAFPKMSSSRKITPAEKAQYIQALRTHQVNTLVELRRVEKAFAVLGTSDCSEPMTSAWSYYVDSHGLLTELRSLTRNYPFSSDCLDEAKRRVYSDPASNRSWNLCWLALSKIQSDRLVPYYARYQASLPSMWAGHTPSEEQITQLTNAFVAEWNWAIGQMLRHWEQPPRR